MRTKHDMPYDPRSFESMSRYQVLLMNEKRRLENPDLPDMVRDSLKLNNHPLIGTITSERINDELGPVILKFSTAIIADRMMEINDELRRIRADMAKILTIKLP